MVLLPPQGDVEQQVFPVMGGHHLEADRETIAGQARRDGDRRVSEDVGRRGQGPVVGGTRLDSLEHVGEPAFGRGPL